MKLVSGLIWIILISGVWFSAVKSPAILTESEQIALQAIFQHEKMAHDASQVFYNKWQQPVFKRIAANEQAQLQAMHILLERYQDNEERATDESWQNFYKNTIENGLGSKTEALRAAALIEETTIRNIRKAKHLCADRKDIAHVCESLMRASRNHLRVLVRMLEARQAAYSPQILTAAEWESIVNSEQEHQQAIAN